MMDGPAPNDIWLYIPDFPDAAADNHSIIDVANGNVKISRIIYESDGLALGNTKDETLSVEEWKRMTSGRMFNVTAMFEEADEATQTNITQTLYALIRERNSKGADS